MPRYLTKNDIHALIAGLEWEYTKARAAAGPLGHIDTQSILAIEENLVTTKTLLAFFESAGCPEVPVVRGWTPNYHGAGAIG